MVIMDALNAVRWDVRAPLNVKGRRVEAGKRPAACHAAGAAC